MANINATALRDALVRLLRSTPDQVVDFASDTAPLRGRAVGDVLRAQVLAQLPNGRSILEVDGAPFDVKLPVAVSTGQTLELEVLAADPKPTFALRSAPIPVVEIPKDAAPPVVRTAGQLLQAQVMVELPNGQMSLAIEGAR